MDSALIGVAKLPSLRPAIAHSLISMLFAHLLRHLGR